MSTIQRRLCRSLMSAMILAAAPLLHAEDSLPGYELHDLSGGDLEHAHRLARSAAEIARGAHEHALQLAQSAADAARRTNDYAQRDVDAALRDADAALQDAAEIENMASLSFMSQELGTGRETVLNAPYAADAVTETTQTLADGNRIVRRTVNFIVRDAAGRTRQEKKEPRAGTVFISDPVEKRAYVLRNDRKIAIRLPRVALAAIAPVPPVPPVPGVAPVPPTPPIPPAPPWPSLLPGGDGRGDVEVAPGRVIVRKSARGDHGESVSVEVIRVTRGEGEAPPLPIPPMPPLTLHGQAFSLPAGARQGVREALGTREFSGIKAEGSRVTRTIPAGSIGNEKPIALVSERWYSPELRLVLMSRNSDPRSGETVYRLENLSRAEPAPELFRVPADYKLRGDERVQKAR